jgi:predicted membrane-bound spermidine synthase
MRRHNVLEVSLLAGLLLSGAAALIYEVVWMRALSLVMGSTTYALSTMLAAFMTGLAFGGYLGGLWADRTRNPAQSFALLEAGIALFGLMTFIVIKNLSPVYAWVFYAFNFSFSSLSFTEFFLSFVVMLVPTTLMGATFPLVLKARAKSLEELGRETGDVYSINNLGAVIGSFCAGFFLIPVLGLYSANLVAIILNLVVAFIFMIYFSRGPFLEKTGVCLILPLLFILFSGCTKEKSSEEAGLKIVIAKYNNALVEAYKNQFFERLEQVADDEEIRRVDIIVSAYLRTKKIMEPELHKVGHRRIGLTGGSI